jgi:hypothetical protein
MPYMAEYTDTFGGEANYCWVKRAWFTVPDGASNRSILMRARKEIGLKGVKGDITAAFGNGEAYWKPRNSCTILMTIWVDYVPEEWFTVEI